MHTHIFNMVFVGVVMLFVFVPFFVKVFEIGASDFRTFRNKRRTQNTLIAFNNKISSRFERRDRFLAEFKKRTV